jgi:hypothetical protein
LVHPSMVSGSSAMDPAVAVLSSSLPPDKKSWNLQEFIYGDLPAYYTTDG